MRKLVTAQLQLLVFSTATIAITATTALGQSAARGSDTTTLEPVIVSATKTPASRALLTQAVTVISGDELRARGVSRVSDAIRQVPGAAVVQNGSFGSVTTVFLRGGESRYTKVLIDGVAVNSSGGFFDLSHLTTDNVERIEIVRGPASVVHGADAMAGAIHIFTRQGRGPATLDVDARAGTYGTREGFIGVNGSSGRAKYSISGAHRETDGLLPFNNRYYNGTLSGSAGVAPRDGSDIALSGRYTTAEFHYPTDFTGAPVDSNAYRVQHRLTVGLEAGTRLSRISEARLLIGTNDVADLTEDIATPFGSSVRSHSALSSRSYRRSAEGRVRLNLSEATLNLGVEYAKERESSTNSEGPVGQPTIPTSTFVAARSNTAAYSELLGKLASGVAYTLSARVDDNSDYAAVGTYRAGFRFPLNAFASPKRSSESAERVRETLLRGSVSSAFNAPAFNQLRPTLYTSGSPDLAPERARNFELGLEQPIGGNKFLLSGSYFNQRFSDLIQYVQGGPPGFLGSYANLSRASSNGVELELRLEESGGVSGNASYTVASPKVTQVSSSYTGDLKPGQALIRRPTHSGNVNLTYSRRDVLSLSATAGFIGKRPDLDFTQFPSPTVTLPAYGKLDLAAIVGVLGKESSARALSLTLRMENALGKRYQDVLNFPAPGRTILVGARYEGRL